MLCSNSCIFRRKCSVENTLFSVLHVACRTIQGGGNEVYMIFMTYSFTSFHDSHPVDGKICHKEKKAIRELSI